MFIHKNLQKEFIFCPIIRTVKAKSLLEEGIFASDIEMSSMTETRNCIPVFFTTSGFNDKEINKIRLQTAEEYLQDSLANEDFELRRALERSL